MAEAEVEEDEVQETREGLSSLWEKKKTRKVEFANYHLIKQTELEKLLDELPKKYAKRPEDMSQKSRVVKRTRDLKDVEASEEAKLLNLKSSDNERATAISIYLEKTMNRSLDWVSNNINCVRCSR